MLKIPNDLQTYGPSMREGLNSQKLPRGSRAILSSSPNVLGLPSATTRGASTTRLSSRDKH